MMEFIKIWGNVFGFKSSRKIFSCFVILQCLNLNINLNINYLSYFCIVIYIYILPVIRRKTLISLAKVWYILLYLLIQRSDQFCSPRAVCSHNCIADI